MYSSPFILVLPLQQVLVACLAGGKKSNGDISRLTTVLQHRYMLLSVPNFYVNFENKSLTNNVHFSFCVNLTFLQKAVSFY